MRRIVIALMGTVSGVVLLFSYHTSTRSAGSVADAPTGPATAGDSTTGDGTTSDGTTSDGTTSDGTTSDARAKTYTGSEAQTRWGIVQVQITVQDGKITQSQAVEYPQENPRDVEINDYALPQLAQEVVQQQSADIDAVSGATVTSDGYIQSLQSAIDQAHL